MSNLVRFLPPANPSNGGSVIGGVGENPAGVSLGGAQPRIYPTQGTTIAPGATLDVPIGDAAGLGSLGWIPVGQVGPTSGRPALRPPGSGTDVGTFYCDTTLTLVIIWDGETWRNPLTGASV